MHKLKRTVCITFGSILLLGSHVYHAKADDTAAIQAALDAGGIVTLQAGTSCISNNLRISHNNTTLTGQSNHTSILKVCIPWSTPPFLGSIAALLELIHRDVPGTQTHLTGVTLKDIVLDGGITSTSETNYPKCVSGLYADNIVIDNVWFQNWPRECIWPAGSPIGHNWRISNSLFTNIGNATDGATKGDAVQ
jgi:hypothetical protein